MNRFHREDVWGGGGNVTEKKEILQKNYQKEQFSEKEDVWGGGGGGPGLETRVNTGVFTSKSPTNMI